MKRGFLQLSLAAALAANAMGAGLAHAAGALAVGVAPGGAQHGFSFGVVWNGADADKAQANALSRCRTAKESNPPARDRCTLVGSFTHKCAAIAMDPKDGTPGIGWAIAADRADANEQAMANCKATAGPERVGFCKVSSSHCDGEDNDK
jgi:hypothetical protein